MINENKNLIKELLNAIESDWAICDEKDKDEHMVLVNEDRDEHPTLKPLKSLVQQIEKEEYILFDEKKSDAKDKEREYMDFLDKKIPVPFVYFYEVTDKGKKFNAS